jgi:pre-rRNA-processing protein IPI3
MLSETILASISAHNNSNSQSSSGAVIPPVKDAAIFKLAIDSTSRALPSIYKASATGPYSLAASDSHIFAAQSAKSAVHVYNVEKGNQEATVPFPEKITAIATAGDIGQYLIIGSESGNVLIWEVK